LSASEQISDRMVDHVTDSFSRQGLMAHLGARISRLERGVCELSVVCRLEAYAVGATGRQHAATGRQTLIRLADRPDHPSEG
jgi:hypothetical protein